MKRRLKLPLRNNFLVFLDFLEEALCVDLA